MANDMGEYFILNVPPGTYTLVVNVIGYVPLRVVDTRVNADLTTTLNFELESTILESAEAVEVVATRDLVEKSLTSTRTIVDAEEIQALPVVNIAEVVLTTAGSFAGNLRGGRAEDQQTTIDGSTVTGQHDNRNQAFEINPYMIQELEVKTGTFNAEYVNALSGITSVVTRDGGSQFSGNFEYRTLGQKGLNWAKPPDMDLADAYRAGTLSEADLRTAIEDAIKKTAEFNNDPARAEDGLRLKDPFDTLIMTGPADGWTASYSRDNYYWDYDRINPEIESSELLVSHEWRSGLRRGQQVRQPRFPPGQVQCVRPQQPDRETPGAGRFRYGRAIGQQVELVRFRSVHRKLGSES